MKEAQARFEQYLKRRFGQSSTLKHYQSDLNIFIAIIGSNKAPEAVTPPDPETPPPAAPAPIAENPGAQGEGVQPNTNAGTETAAAAPAAAARRLPVIDVEIPASSDPAIDKQWESAAKNLASKDFKGADTAFADLAKRADTATREAARLARAVWWTANGRENEVKPVIADLAANATTPSVREHARGLLRSN